MTTIQRESGWNELPAAYCPARTVSPPKPTAEQLAATAQRDVAQAESTERHRVTERAKVREAMARSQMAENQHAKIVVAIADVNNELDGLALEHQHTTGPLQTELAEIEKRQIAAIIAREKPDQILESRRQTVLAEVVDVNAGLDVAIAGLKSKLAVLERERVKLARQITEPVLRGQLLELASPAASLRLRVAQSDRSWAEARQRSAIEKLERRPSDAFLRAELASAGQNLQRAIGDEQSALTDVMEE